MAPRKVKKARRDSGRGGRQREFLYRGHTLEELQQMPVPDVLPLLPARTRRTLKRGLPPTYQRLMEQVSAGVAGVKTHYREMPILPTMVGKELQVHNGKEWVRVHITVEMIGHKLGEFALTRKEVKHTGPGVGATRSSKFMPLK